MAAEEIVAMQSDEDFETWVAEPSVEDAETRQRYGSSFPQALACLMRSLCITEPSSR